MNSETGMRAGWIAGVLGGAWIREPESDAVIHGASIDTRTLEPGQVFFAIPGEHVDGHAYLTQAAEAGCPLAVVEREIGDPPEGMGVLRVGSSREALTALASAYRRSLAGLRVIGVTGSNGKTTTVRMIHAALAAGALRGSHSAKSHNNALGLPLTLLAVRPSDGYVVCEIGTSVPGEIARLTAIAEPDVAVITSIGRAHLEALGSVEGVAREKTDLLRGLPNGGLGLVTADSEVLRAELAGDTDLLERIELVRVGVDDSATVRVSNVETDGDGAGCVVDGVALRTGLAGEHNAMNGALAFELARRLGVAPADAVSGVAGAEAPPMRLERFEVDTAGGPIWITNDAYNANPESMAAAVRLFDTGRLDPFGAGMNVGRRVAVLGEMLEMGDHAARAHDELAQKLCDAGGIDALMLVGSHSERMTGIIGRARPDMVVLSAQDPGGSWIDGAAGLVRAGDHVLLKGSRGARLERLAEALRSARVE